MKTFPTTFTISCSNSATLSSQRTCSSPRADVSFPARGSHGHIQLPLHWTLEYRSMALTHMHMDVQARDTFSTLTAAAQIMNLGQSQLLEDLSLDVVLVVIRQAPEEIGIAEQLPGALPVRSVRKSDDAS
ncbi:hypothetical protein EYF80_046930 [Liparis tanakae]|uniref:Uncharacterized protein n=1 Tax=Liparis tanakae TaxID=230148 RepID=A0A4Z2FQ20_9TELE|nr:hypothetical protein EYF80_046930 [Liparis tanakae]